METEFSNPNMNLDESVDEILNQIIGQDGGFNNDFTELYAKYLGGKTAEMTDALDTDISDRVGEVDTRVHIEYEDPDLVVKHKADSDRKIKERLPENMRDMYSAAEKKVQRPEFTAGGEVRYPSMGVGESEERVVYDADWEAKAKEEAARREAIRRDNMLRGDSTYARSFVAGGRPMSGKTQHSVQVNPAFIDPLTEDEIRQFNMPEERLRNREKSLEETFGRASDEEKKGGLFRRTKKNK